MKQGFKSTLNQNILAFRRIAGDPVLFISILIILISLVIFILYPLYEVLITSFRDSSGNWSLKPFERFFTSRLERTALRNSLVLGLATAIGGSVVGFLFAFTVTRTNVPFKRLLNIIAIVPIISPPFIGAMAIIMLFGRNGLISYQLLGIRNLNIYGFWGLMFAQVITFFPVAYITLKGVLESISPTLEDAALDLGGSRWRVFRKVTLPLTYPGIASAMLVLFIETLSDFGNPLILAGSGFPVLSVQAYLQITGMFNLPRGAALAVVLLIPSVLAFFVQKYWVSRKQYVTITGKPTSSSIKLVSQPIQWVLFGLCVFVAGLVVLVYTTIVWAAFARVWGHDMYSLTLRHFQYVFGVGFNAVRDTLIIAGTSTPVAGILGMVIAFLVVRKRFPGRQFMDFSSMLSFAVPGTVIGIGYILAFNKPPLVLTGTFAILAINFIFRYIPVGIQSGIAILRQVDPSIEEAAIDLGADAKTSFRKVTLPLMLPAFFSGLTFSFVRAMTAISAAIFLVSANWNLMTVQIMAQVESGRFGAASAFSVVLVAIILLAMMLIRLILTLGFSGYKGKLLQV